MLFVVDSDHAPISADLIPTATNLMKPQGYIETTVIS